EVTQRVPEQHEGSEQHALLTLEVGAGEERADRRGHGEEPLVEHVHELVAARGDLVEADFERIDVEVHDVLFLGCPGGRWTRVSTYRMPGGEGRGRRGGVGSTP